jgi:hypothetical protein
VIVRERLEFSERLGVDLAAILMNAAKQSLSRCAEGSVSPAGGLLPWIALLPLEDPLQGIILDSPIRVELGCERI